MSKNLKELRNCNQKLFFIPYRNRWKHKLHVKLLIFKINLHFRISDEIFTYEKLSLLPINSMFLVFSSREMHRKLIQAKVHYKVFYSVSKEVSHKPLKVDVLYKVEVLPMCVYHWYNLLWWIFLLYVITGNSIFTLIYRYPESWWNRHVAAFFETSVLKEVHILFPLSP